ncbi:MAG: rhomboid family intramembrane serine protease [Verrucomicrobiaceae bacterium]|nr:MAG: rhomboid family intramembrane serine protease [Verrucomicrobiaceae bacterium]
MPSPSLLDRCERRFGHLAIPGLLRVIAGFQALCFVLITLNPDFRNFLEFSSAAWQKGQVWRFFTFCFIPQTTSVLWIIFVILILIRIGDVLEEAWGRFRLNLYYISSVIALWAAVLTSSAPVGGLASLMLYMSLFLAFATILPDYTFMIFFILPVKVKWLALINAAFMLYYFVAISEIRLPMVIALIPYACFGLPILLRNMRQKAQVAHRRVVYQEASVPAGEPFHECRICHRTDHTNPGLEFRIAGDDQEYCVEHLPK